jgi:hypothetical protein
MNGLWRVALLGGALAAANLCAQTDGTAGLRVTLLDYNGSSTKHWTVVWVTTGSGTFIKTLWKQGPTISASQWNSHCGQWYAAKAGSTALDGYSSATATSYTGANSPVILSWNCRDAATNLVADGAYKFWVQYAEDNGQGPYTTSGLLWTKGAAGLTNTYPNQGANFADMRVAWVPALPPAVAPTITSALPPATGIVGVPYSFACAASGTAPIVFTAQGLPPGLGIGGGGLISGTPTTGGAFTGAITAANGTLPNATQSFDIRIGVVPITVRSIRSEAGQIVLSGAGPANGVYTVLATTNLSLALDRWAPVRTNGVNAAGQFSFTNTLDASPGPRLYLLRMP